MIEVLYDAIKAVAGQEIDVTVAITEMNIDSNDTCAMVIHAPDGEAMIAQSKGRYIEELDMWQFTFPASATAGLEGRYWYCVQCNGDNVCFKQPLYLIG